jgi:hypothetical protein
MDGGGILMSFSPWDIILEAFVCASMLVVGTVVVIVLALGCCSSTLVALMALCPPPLWSSALCGSRLGVYVHGSSRIRFASRGLPLFSWSSLSSVVATFAAWVTRLARLCSSIALAYICVSS